MSDLHEVIEDSIDDVVAPVETPETTSETPETPVETSSEVDSPAKSEAEAAPSTSEVQSPAARSAAQTEPEDDFAKRHGLPAQRVGERENRIPYSAVKRIVGNAEKKAVSAALDPVTKELGEFKAKVTDYEGRLKQVAEFERVLANDPQQFLNMLTKIPAYRQIFEGLSRQQAQPQPQAQKPEPPPTDEPQPDITNPDGSKVYSYEGFKKREAWLQAQTEKRIMDQLAPRLQPFEQEAKFRAWQQAVIPQINNQIAEARKWVQFNENEAEIVKALQDNPQMGLQDAYIHVVIPKLSGAANDARARAIADIRRAPTTTSVPSSATKPTVAATGPRSLEDIIADSIKDRK